jgi:hypothetical protein
MKNKILLTILSLSLMNYAKAQVSPFHNSLVDFHAKIKSMSTANKLPQTYRDFMSFYSRDSHSDFISLRDSWIKLLILMPETLSSEEVSLVADFAENKFLQQLTLEELTYYSFIYESWTRTECVSKVRPFMKGALKVFGPRSAPFALSSNSSLLTATYLSFKPSEKIYPKSIHACLNLQGEPSLASFLQVSKDLVLVEASKETPVSLNSELVRGRYKTLLKNPLSLEEKAVELDVYNEGLGANLVNYNICFPSSPGLEDRCFNAFGKTCSSRRN